MDYKQIIGKVDEQFCLDFLSKMVQFKSYSATDGEREIAKYMQAQMADLGLESELEPIEDTDGRVNAIGRWQGQGGGKSLLFNGHLDTNPVTAGWTVDPWAGLVDENFIYGIGVSNMKSGDAAYFCAVKTLIDQGIKLKGDVILTFVVGELQGGVGSIQAIKNGLRADYFVNSEPTDLKALTLHAGAFNFVIEITGVTRHVSKREEAVDAIAAACELIPEINAMTFSGAATEEHKSVNRANVGVIRGSLSPEFHDWRAPQIADFVRLAGTGRYAPSQSEDVVLADLRAKLDELEARFPGLSTKVFREQELDGLPTMLPFEVSKSSRIVKAINAAYEAVRGEPQPTGPFPPPCFYGTDAAHFLHLAGMEGIVCGPGGRFNTMPDERVEISDFLDMVKIYILTILEICEVS